MGGALLWFLFISIAGLLKSCRMCPLILQAVPTPACAPQSAVWSTVVFSGPVIRICSVVKAAKKPTVDAKQAVGLECLRADASNLCRFTLAAGMTESFPSVVQRCLSCA